jgi:hypothetical protein
MAIARELAKEKKVSYYSYGSSSDMLFSADPISSISIPSETLVASRSDWIWALATLKLATVDVTPPTTRIADTIIAPYNTKDIFFN